MRSALELVSAGNTPGHCRNNEPGLATQDRNNAVVIRRGKRCYGEDSDMEDKYPSAKPLSPEPKNSQEERPVTDIIRTMRVWNRS